MQLSNQKDSHPRVQYVATSAQSNVIVLAGRLKRGNAAAGTYTTHAWRIRETSSGRLLGTYVGEEATVEMTSAAACLVHKGFNPGQAFGRKTYPSSWGKFTERAKVKQIPVRVRIAMLGSFALPRIALSLAHEVRLY